MAATGAITDADVYKIAARLERLPLTRWHTKMRVIIGTAWFFDAFDALAISYVLPVLIGLWKLQPSEIGLLIAIGYAGQVIGSLSAGWLAERWGRVPVMALTLLIFTLGSFACIFAWSLNSLLWMRFVQGVGLGGEVPVMHTFMSEFAKAEKRGRFALTVQILFSVGLAAAGILATWIVPLGWQWMFVVGAVPALLVFPFRFMLIESPRWLASHGRGAEADAVMKKLEAMAIREGKALPELRADVPVVQQRKARLPELFQGIYLKRTLTLWALWWCSYFVGYGVQTWMPSLYRTALRLPAEDAVRYASITPVAQLAGGIVCVLAIDYFGRKKLIGGCLFMVSLPLLTLGFVMGKLDATTVFWFVTLGMPFLSGASLGLGIWTAENYPTHLRAIGSGVAGAWVRAASVVGPYVVGFVLPHWGLNAVFGVFGLTAIIGAIVCYLFATETKGQVLEILSPPLDPSTGRKESSPLAEARP